MSRVSTVSVNGTVYDERTGRPLRIERSATSSSRSASSVHARLQHSQTLSRRYLRREPVVAATQKPASAPAKATTTIQVRRQPTAPASVARSEQITRFAQPAKQPAKKQSMNDIAPAKHALVERADARLRSKQPAQTMPKPSDVLKREAIAEATAKMAPRQTKKARKLAKKRKMPKFQRFLSTAAASLAVLVLGAYFTYLNMPAISTRVAASQAGINASYPAYQPSGYSLSGPVAYQQGSVTMKFAANGSPQNYTISQTRSDWDSTAVLDSYVEPQAGNDYSTTTASGLTIYTYGNNAAWVNGGILYTISGNASLSSDQIQRIAASL